MDTHDLAWGCAVNRQGGARHSFVFPVHDAVGTTLARLGQLWPVLATVANRAYIGITPITQAHCDEAVADLAQHPFFEVVSLVDHERIGDQLAVLYQMAASQAAPDDLLHLCFSDRLAFAVGGHHRDQFLADVARAGDLATPLIFARSEFAWSTHPRNYREIEGFVTTLGELLFGRRLDFAWCHMAVRAGRLIQSVDAIRNHDLSVLCELVLAMRDHVVMREVDWLEWEDPTELGRDPAVLRKERESSVAETDKRLGYAIPMMETLLRAATQKGPA